MNKGKTETWAALERVLSSLQNEEYCLVKKRHDFPSIPLGADVDLYVGSLTKARSIIRSSLSELADSGCRIHEEVVGPHHVHMDWICGGELVVRFDLYGRTPSFKRLQLTSHYFQRVLESRVVEFAQGSGEQMIQLFVPSKEMEYVLRVCEYAEYYWTGPDKIQHVDYLLASSGLTREEGLRILHEVTKVPCVSLGVEEPRAAGSVVRPLADGFTDWCRSWASIPVVRHLRESRVGLRIESRVRKRSLGGD